MKLSTPKSPLILLLFLCVVSCTPFKFTSGDMKSRSIWSETTFSKTVFSLPTSNVLLSAEELLEEVSGLIDEGGRDWSLSIYRDAVFRMEFSDDDIAIDGWIDVRARNNGSSYYYFNGIEAHGEGTTMPLKRSVAVEIYQRARSEMQEVIEEVYPNAGSPTDDVG